MSQPASEVLTVRLPTELATTAQQLATQRHISISELLRLAVITYLEPNSIRYEIIKTRALFLQFLKKQHSQSEIDSMYDQAEHITQAYLKIQQRAGESS